MERRTPSFSNFRSSSLAASTVKRRNRKTGGRAEWLLRRTLWRYGLRYRKNVRGLPGTPDIVFWAVQLAIFVDGDFWHGRSWDILRNQLACRANSEYWIAKISANRVRDTAQNIALANMGWKVLRLWETEVLASPSACAQHVAATLGRLRSSADR
jgi:DNA mismatch endonuclease Vsr